MMMGAGELGSLTENADVPSRQGSPDSFATDSEVGVWPEEDRSAIARHTRSRELEKIYPGLYKPTSATPKQKREQGGRENRGKRDNRGADECERPPESHRERAASTKSDSSRWSMRSRFIPPNFQMGLSRNWANEVLTQFTSKVKMETIVANEGRTSLSSMKPSVLHNPSRRCSTTASCSNVSNKAQLKSVGAASS